MLDDVEPYRDWLNREHPSEAATSVAAAFIGRLGRFPWTSPSVPIDTSGQPISEIRLAALSVPGEPDVRIRYRYIYASERVDLLDITNARQ